MTHSSHVWNLVLSTRCAVCGTSSHDAICSSCSTLLQRLSPSQWGRDRAGVPLLRAVGRHEGALREAILAWKERGRADLTEFLATLLQPLIPMDALIVPVPTRWSARRLRGECVISSLAECVSNAPVAHALIHQRPSEDQTAISFTQRSTNVERTLAVKATALPKLTRSVIQGRPIVVLDDIYTTGATAREAIRALHEVNVSVSLVVVLGAAGKDRWRGDAPRTSV